MKFKEKSLKAISGNSKSFEEYKLEQKVVKRGLSRRNFLKSSTVLAFAGGITASVDPLAALMTSAAEGRPLREAKLGNGGYGDLSPLQDMRDGVLRLALPAGFSYVGFGFEGDIMSDGNPTPKAHDGMAAFALPNGNIRLVRNHEDRNDSQTATVKGDPSKAYDTKAGGSNTSLEIKVNADGTPELVRDFISINGTFVNCAGGATPFSPEGGAWLTCEETTNGTGPFIPDAQGRPFQGINGFNKPHGYVFEVPVLAEEQVIPAALTAMGRFSHEAVAIDPVTGIVYETEDDGDSGFYRFLPNDSNNLAAGGTLQMLAIRNRPNYNTRTGQTVPRALPVVWVEIDDPDPAAAETNSSAVFEQGLSKGGAIFSRLEGCWYANGSIFFNATSGGDAGEGQVWEYHPTSRNTGTLKLIFESPGETVLDNPDNITVSPRGGVLLCEDGDLDNLFLRGLTKDGRIFDFAQNLVNNREWAGATFSPDGKTLFVNIQGETRGFDTMPPSSGDIGMTFAIWGPWEKGAL